MYPWECKYEKFPIGHPKVYVGDGCRYLVGETNSLVKCSVLAPLELYHRVLPHCAQNKLLFSLCRRCCEELNQGDWEHEDVVDRAFTGTWVADEIKRAVSVGYEVTAAYKIWQYKTVRYKKRTGESGLFEEYINAFLKLNRRHKDIQWSAPPRRTGGRISVNTTKMRGFG